MSTCQVRLTTVSVVSRFIGSIVIVSGQQYVEKKKKMSRGDEKTTKRLRSVENIITILLKFVDY